MYGTLCALATFPRAAIKARISENSVFGAYMEQEPYIRELVEAYTNSSFKTVLDILSRYSVRAPPCSDACARAVVELIWIWVYSTRRHGTMRIYIWRRMCRS